MSAFKPMLAVEYDPAKLQFPVFASPKLDGIRAVVKDGKLLSRSLKLIPNKHVQSMLARPEFDGFDGELIAGSPTAPNAMQEATSLFMSQDKVQPFTWFVFDQHDMPGTIYDTRLFSLENQVEDMYNPAHVKVLPQTTIADLAALDEYEAVQVGLGYEGVILRAPRGQYKYGRSTVKEGWLLKVKRFTDSEAIVLGFEEQMHNTNEKQVNELGRSKRSTHAAGLVGKGTLGALVVRDIVTGVEFNVGTGMTDGVRDHIWANRDSHEGMIVKYKSFLVGVKTAPRHPVFIGFRSPLDMS
jgi:DNA ligase-1